MRPQIKHPNSLKHALNYNEKKVQNDKAVLIDAANFLKNPDELNFHNKLNRLQNLMDLNERAETKLIHLSLNFHPSETERMTPEFLKTLSQEYMEKLGFGNQPYLVYQHFDAGHPHVHILSTLIKEDGTRINTHNLAKDVSEPIRKEMEETYGLVKADKKEQSRQKEETLSVNSPKVHYGRSETLRGITNALDQVIDRYKYTSLPELNAVLKEYNVMADRGAEDSRMYKNRGLYYRVLDESGHKAGVPIKASDIYSKPTLDYIEKKFSENEVKRQADKSHLKTAIDWQIKKQPGSLQEFRNALEKERITVVVHRSEAAGVYGLTYISHEKKAVFNGSDLGKEYGAKKTLERLGIEQEKPLAKEQSQEQTQRKDKEQVKETNTNRTKDKSREPDKSQQLSSLSSSATGKPSTKEAEKDTTGNAGGLLKEAGKIIQQLIEPEQSAEQLDAALREEEKRRKRKDQSLER